MNDNTSVPPARTFPSTTEAAAQDTGLRPADSAHPPAGDNAAPAGAGTAVLELRVRNHPGTMSHVTGLFARRAFNLEAIVCVPVDDGATSCMLLLVPEEPRLEQVERQLAKLHDVLTVRHRSDLSREFFSRLSPMAV